MAALLAGVALRAFFAAHHPRFVGDTLVYADLANNLRLHRLYGLTEDHIRSTLIRLPGYPLFLALCFALFGKNNFLAVVGVQVGLDLLGCVLLGLLARQIFGRQVGATALWLAVLCPFTANYTAAVLTETGSLLCVSAALWALAQWVTATRRGVRAVWSAVIVGFALAWAALLRPDGVLLAAAVLPVMAWVGWRAADSPRRRALRGLLLAACILLLPLGIWTARNWRVFHVVQPLAPKYANDPDEVAPLGFARWYRTWAIGFGDTVRVYWTYDGSPLDLSGLPARAFDSPAQHLRTEEIYTRYNTESAATAPVDKAFAQLAAERIGAHPVRYYVLLPMAKLADMWLHPRTELMKLPLDWWDFRARPRAALFSSGYGLLNAVLLALAVVGLARWRRAGWRGYGTVAFAGVTYVLLRSAMLLTIDNSEPRYTLECYPVVLLLAAVALTRPTLPAAGSGV